MNLKYFLTVGAIKKEVTPFGNSDFGMSFEKPEDKRFSYIAKPTKSILLTGQDFEFLYAHEQSTMRCAQLSFEVHSQCQNNTYALYRSYVVSMNSCTFDLDKCVVEMPLILVSPYLCFDENKSIEIDLFTGISTTHTGEIYRGTVEYVNYTSATSRDYFKDAEFPEADPELKGWVLYHYKKIGSPLFEYKYAREKIVVPCADEMPLPWIELIACSSGTKTMVRPVPTYNREILGTDTSARPPRTGWESFPRYYEGWLFTSLLVGTTEVGGAITNGIDNGMLLADVLSLIANNTCGKNFKSNFFQVNPDGPFASVYPTLKAVKTENVFVYQKSDIKRPNAIQNATIAKITPEKFIEDICNKFNCWYILDETNLQIEHVSFFQRTIGLDTLLLKHSRGMQQSKKYSYADTELPEREIYKDVEQYNFDFVGLPIIYQDSCATKGSEVVTEMEYLTTDMEHVLTGGVQDAEGNDNGEINEDGFVIASMEVISGTYYFLREPPVLDIFVRLNNPFAWAQLHNDFFKHDRPQIAGIMNGLYGLFFTAKPAKKGQDIAIAFCCNDVFKLTDYINTALGIGIVGAAVIDYISDKFTITPLYYQEQAAYICLAPLRFQFIRFNTLPSVVAEFEIAYQTPGPKNIELQVLNTAGSTLETHLLSDIAPGAFTLPFTLAEGSYKFKARVICDEVNSSAWSTVVAATFVDCSQVYDAAWVTFMAFTASGASRGFKFSVLVSNVDGLRAEVEVTRPDGIVFVDSTFLYRQIGSAYEFTIVPEQGAIPAGANTGLYKFRFRFSCNNTQKGPWSSFKNVTL